MKNCLIFLLCALCVSFRLHAQTPFHLAKPAISTQGETIIYSGFINREGVAEAISIIKAGNFKALQINSKGGEILSGMDFGEVIFDHKLDVIVSELCNSSCANYIFPSGRRKTIKEGAFVIWHGDARQRNFLEQKARLELKAANSPQEMLVDDWKRLNFERESISRQDIFYKKIGIDGRIARLGHELSKPYNVFTLNATIMAMFDITQVDAPPDYGKPAYCQKWLRKYYERPAAVCLEPFMLEIEQIRSAP